MHLKYTQEQLLEFLRSHAITYQLYTHQPLFTCEQALEAIAELAIPGTGIKNLFLKDSKKKLYLIVASYDTRVDLKTTGKTLEAKELRFADATLLMNHLGVEPGSVTPLATINDTQHDVQIIVDAAIFNSAFIQVHPLHNTATVVIIPADLIAFFKAINRSYLVYDFVNHQLVADGSL
jgi:Ala-tRNA(Pro) deacylase